MKQSTQQKIIFTLLYTWLFMLLVTLSVMGLRTLSAKQQKTVTITKIVVVKDARATELLSEIMGQDCSNITVFEANVTATAYTACKDECDSTPEVTANMTPSRIGILALSRDLLEIIPMGSRVIIPELGVFQVANKPIADVYEVADKMNKRFKSHIDILHANKKAAKLFGRKKVKLIWFK